MRFNQLHLALPLIGSLSFCACEPQVDSDSNASDGPAEVAPVSSDEGGVITATIDADSASSQLVSASANSSLGESSVVFPPGSLAISGDVSIGEGDSLAAAAELAELGAEGADPLGSTMVVSSTVDIAANAPLTIALDTGSSFGLLLQDSTTLAILYKVQSASGTLLGVIPRSKIRLNGGIAKTIFRHTEAFRSVAFQAIRTMVVITEEKSVSTSGEVKVGTSPATSGEEEKDPATDEDAETDSGSETDPTDDLEGLYGLYKDQYLNLEDAGITTATDRVAHAELELMDGVLHTTCDANKMATIGEAQAATLTATSAASLSYTALTVEPVPGTIVIMRAYTSNSYCPAAADLPVGIYKVKIEKFDEANQRVYFEMNKIL